MKHATRGVLLAATALAGAFAGLAAHSFAGHTKGRAIAVRTRTVRRVVTQAQQTTTQAQEATTTTAAPPPAVTTVAPVAVSGAT